MSFKAELRRLLPSRSEKREMATPSFLHTVTHAPLIFSQCLEKDPGFCAYLRAKGGQEQACLNHRYLGGNTPETERGRRMEDSQIFFSVVTAGCYMVGSPRDPDTA